MTTTYVFTASSLVSGLARTFDVFGALSVYDWSKTTEQADARAAHSDWAAVADHITEAMQVFSTEHADQLSLFCEAEEDDCADLLQTAE